MSRGRDKLRAYVQRILREKNLTLRDVEIASKRKGDGISHSAVHNVINNPKHKLYLETLEAIARGLGVPEEDVIDAARGVEPPSDYEVRLCQGLTRRYRNSSPETKQYVERFIKSVYPDFEMEEEPANTKR